MPPETCPNCGAHLSRNAKACPGCGSDEKTGWAEDAYAGGLGLPDEDFDYNEFVKSEFGEKKGELKPKNISWLWWAVAVLIVLLFVLGYIL